MTTIQPSAPADRYGDAIIGRTLFDLRGIRFVDGEGGNTPPAKPQTPEGEQTPPEEKPAAPKPSQIPAAKSPKPDKPADDGGELDFDELDPKTQRHVKALRQEAQKANTKYRDLVKQLAVEEGIVEPEAKKPDGKAPSGPTDREKALEVENAALRVAVSMPNVNAAALMDSRSFLTNLSQLEASDTDAIKAAITKAVGSNPALTTTKLPPSSGEPAKGATKSKPLTLEGAVSAALDAAKA